MWIDSSMLSIQTFEFLAGNVFFFFGIFVTQNLLIVNLFRHNLKKSRGYSRTLKAQGFSYDFRFLKVLRVIYIFKTWNQHARWYIKLNCLLLFSEWVESEIRNIVCSSTKKKKKTGKYCKPRIYNDVWQNTMNTLKFHLEQVLTNSSHWLKLGKTWLCTMYVAILHFVIINYI